MLARRLPGLLPPLSNEEALEVTAIHSVAGLLSASRGLSRAASVPRAASHRQRGRARRRRRRAAPGRGEPRAPGVLFLDELAEFRRSALEALRQPLEDGVVTISRAYAKATFPARLLLVCAMNPCPCGWLGRRERALRLLARPRPRLPRQDERSAARPHRRARRARLPSRWPPCRDPRAERRAPRSAARVERGAGGQRERRSKRRGHGAGERLAVSA